MSDSNKVDSVLSFHCSTVTFTESCSITGSFDFLANIINHSVSFILKTNGTESVFSLSSFRRCDLFFDNIPQGDSYRGFVFNLYVDDFTYISVNADALGDINLSYSYRGLSLKESLCVDSCDAKRLFSAIYRFYNSL